MSNRLPLLARAVMLALSLSAIGVYLYVAASRVAYPFTLEWLEANSFVHVVRVMQGQPLYVAPSYDFIPMIYTPLYFYVAAPLALVSGQVMMAMRLVSLMASLVGFALIYAIGRAQRLAPSVSLLAVGLFSAGYGLMGFWLDVGRVDSLFLALLLAAYWLTFMRSRQDVVTGPAAALALCLACATKQTAVVAFPFLCLYLFVEKRWLKLLAFGLSFSAILIVCIVLANNASNSWFWFYTVTVPSSSPLLPALFANTWTKYLLPCLYPMLLLIGLAAVSISFRRDWQTLIQYSRFVGCLSVPLMAMTLTGMSRAYGYVNDLMPAIAGFAMAGAMASQWLLEPVARYRWITVSLTVGTLAVVGLQFAVLRYAVQPQIPTAADRNTGARLVDLLRQSPAPIYAPLGPYLPYLAGQPIHYQLSSLGDLAAAIRSDPAIAARLAPYWPPFQQRTNEHLNGTVLLAEDRYTDFYRKGPYACRDLMAEGLSPRQFTGAPARFSRLCVYTGR
jgi:hypothetical protein